MTAMFAPESEEREAVALCEEIRALLEAQQRSLASIMACLDRIDERVVEWMRA